MKEENNKLSDKIAGNYTLHIKYYTHYTHLQYQLF